jgi:hypothetical protein
MTTSATARSCRWSMGGGTYVGEMRVRHKDGHAFWVRATGRRVSPAKPRAWT